MPTLAPGARFSLLCEVGDRGTGIFGPGGTIGKTDGGQVTDGRLVVPEGLVIDEVARERLIRQLERQPAEVKGVAAEVGALPPGASYRVHAEWRSLEPLSAHTAATAAVRDLLRKHVAGLGPDRVLAPELAATRSLLHSGAVVEAAQAVVGQLR